MNASSFALIVFSVSMNAAAQIALRKAMLTLGTIPPLGEPLAFLWTFIRNIYLWGGLGCYAISIVLWLAVLSSNQVSVAYPMLSIGYVIAAVLSFLILGETLPPVRLGGIALICVGVILIMRTA
jgi:multidrug transporter EmrE-like cation transporter